MCGRFSLTASGEELADALGLDEPPPTVPRYNIAPSQPVLVVRPQGGRRRAASLRWGLPAAGPGGTTELHINARSETAATRQTFREAYQARRCLIPASGFYEWKRGREGPQPFHIRRRDGRLIAFAGLWSPGPAAAAEGAGCVILTTEASAVVSPIHDRMPVILAPEEYELWLSAGPREQAALASLLRPFGGELEAVPVADAVNSAACEGPQCQAPAPPRPRQGVLFPEM